MQQQQEPQGQTGPILPVIHGFAEPLISAHQRGFPRLDTQCSNPHKETHQGEEADSPAGGEADLQEEDSREEEAADSQEEDLHKVTLTEDHQETD